MIRDGETIKLGGVKLKTVLMPGHAGQHGVELFGERLRKKYNVLFLSSTSGPGFKYVGNTEFPEIIEVFEATFAKLKKLKPDVFLASHGSAVRPCRKNVPARRQSRNPFIETETYPAYLKAPKRRFATRWRRNAQLNRAG